MLSGIEIDIDAAQTDRIHLAVQLAHHANGFVQLSIRPDARDFEVFAEQIYLGAMIASAGTERNRNNFLHATPAFRSSAAWRMAAIFSGVIAASKARMSASSKPSSD